MVLGNLMFFRNAHYYSEDFYTFILTLKRVFCNIPFTLLEEFQFTTIHIALLLRPNTNGQHLYRV